MILSKYAIEGMGFQEHSEEDKLLVTFSIIRVYSLQGLIFESSCEDKRSKTIAFGENCNAVIAQSVNEGCRVLTGNDFADDEAKWLSDNNASPPFALIHFTENEPCMLRGGYRKDDNGNILTYNAFPKDKLEIQDWENNIEIRIITALTVHLSTIDRQVKLLPIARSVFGLTSEGRMLFDIKFACSASAYVSSPKSTDAIASSLDQAKLLFERLSKDAIRHFHAALNENDRLKQFLGFYLFIERFTHNAFKSLTFEGNVRLLFKIAPRVEETSTALFSKMFSESDNIAQRFRWCAMAIWNHLNDDDVSRFLELKKVRDKLAHGEHIDEVMLPVESAKTLGLKLLGTKETQQNA